MILTAFMSIFFIIINFLLSYLPNVTSNSNIGMAMNTVSQYLSALYSFLPYIIGSLLAILVFDIVLETALFTFKIVTWILKRLPTQS